MSAHNLSVRINNGDPEARYTSYRDVFDAVLFGTGHTLESRMRAVAVIDLVRALRHRAVQVQNAEIELDLLEEELNDEALFAGAWT